MIRGRRIDKSWDKTEVKKGREKNLQLLGWAGISPPLNLSPPLILSKMSEYQDGWGYPTDSWSLRGTTNDGLRLCSRRSIPRPRGEPIRILVYKTLPYSLSDATSPAPTLRTREFRPRARTPNKALYCLILWLIGFIFGGA